MAPRDGVATLTNLASSGKDCGGLENGSDGSRFKSGRGVLQNWPDQGVGREKTARKWRI